VSIEAVKLSTSSPSPPEGENGWGEGRIGVRSIVDVGDGVGNVFEGMGIEVDFTELEFISE
jgi:hypothetical protein